MVPLWRLSATIALGVLAGLVFSRQASPSAPLALEALPFETADDCSYPCRECEDPQKHEIIQSVSNKRDICSLGNVQHRGVRPSRLRVPA